MHLVRRVVTVQRGVALFNKSRRRQIEALRNFYNRPKASCQRVLCAPPLCSARRPAMATPPPPSSLARLAEQATRAFEAGEYADARRCLGELENEARADPRDLARLSQNKAVLDFMDTKHPQRLDAAGLRDALRRAESQFNEASYVDDESNADLELDAHHARVLRGNLGWALQNEGDVKDSLSVLQNAFEATFAVDDEVGAEKPSEIVRVGVMLTHALLNENQSEKNAKQALRVLDVIETVLKQRTAVDENIFNNHDAVFVRFALRQRARCLMYLSDFNAASVCVNSLRDIYGTSDVTSTEVYLSDSVTAQLAWLKTDHAAALEVFANGIDEKDKNQSPVRTLNLASVLGGSGANATAALLVDTVARVDADIEHIKLDFVQKTALYRSGLGLLKSGRPAEAAIRIFKGAVNFKGVCESDKWVRLAECASSRASRVEELSTHTESDTPNELEQGEKQAEASFEASFETATGSTIKLTWTGAEKCLDFALDCLEKEETEFFQSTIAYRLSYRPRLRAHICAQRAFVSLALGKSETALQVAMELLAIVRQMESEEKETLSESEKNKKTRFSVDCLAPDEALTFTKLGHRYVCEGLAQLGRVDEAMDRVRVAGLE